MTEQIKRQLSGRRAAALLPAAVLALGALLAACAPEEEPRPPILLNDPPPPIHTGGEPYPHGTIPPEHAGKWEELTALMRQPKKGRISIWNGEVEPSGRNPGLFPCPSHPESIGYVKDQVIFWSAEALDDPEAAIAAELNGHGIQFDSLEVRTAEDYAQHNNTTFFNWLEVDNSNSPYEAFKGHGAELHPNLVYDGASYFKWAAMEESDQHSLYELNLQDNGEPHPNLVADISQSFAEEHSFENLSGAYYAEDLIAQEGSILYQVKLHGHDGDVRGYLELPNIWPVFLLDVPGQCFGMASAPNEHALLLMLLGLYTTFGDDVVIYEEHAPSPFFNVELGLPPESGHP